MYVYVYLFCLNVQSTLYNSFKSNDFKTNE